jgi:hypothetical protein
MLQSTKYLIAREGLIFLGIILTVSAGTFMLGLYSDASDIIPVCVVSYSLYAAARFVLWAVKTLLKGKEDV